MKLSFEKFEFVKFGKQARHRVRGAFGYARLDDQSAWSLASYYHARLPPSSQLCLHSPKWGTKAPRRWSSASFKTVFTYFGIWTHIWDIRVNALSWKLLKCNTFALLYFHSWSNLFCTTSWFNVIKQRQVSIKVLFLVGDIQ